MTRLTLALAGAGCLLATAAAPHAQSVFRTRTDVVVIDAAVMDGRKPVGGLTKDDFEIRDNGVVQPVLDISHESVPLDVTIAIDISGSMKPEDRELVKGAVAQVSDALKATDRARVTVFATSISERTPLTHPPISVDLSQVGGSTAVFDALLLSIISPPIVDRRQFVLFMTDGQDTTSAFDGPVVIETARHSSAATTVILVPSRAPDLTRGLLVSVAAQTGGEVIELKGHDQLSQAFLTALDNFRTSYVLRYSPAGVSRLGWHDVAVTVKSKGYRVRARRGYWGS
jgi:Mg-chelatase subunit ChlD